MTSPRDSGKTFSAAGLDSDARRRLLVFIVFSGLVSVGMLYLLLSDMTPTDGPTWAPVLLLAVAVGFPLIPLFYIGGFPTDFVVEGDVLRIKKRWRSDRELRHEGRAELFNDAGALRRRKFYGSGRPHFSSIVTATTDLPGGKVYFALTDRDRAVLVHGVDGPVVVSPAEPAAFVEAVAGARE